MRKHHSQARTWKQAIGSGWDAATSTAPYATTHGITAPHVPRRTLIHTHINPCKDNNKKYACPYRHGRDDYAPYCSAVHTVSRVHLLSLMGVGAEIWYLLSRQTRKRS